MRESESERKRRIPYGQHQRHQDRHEDRALRSVKKKNESRLSGYFFYFSIEHGLKAFRPPRSARAREERERGREGERGRERERGREGERESEREIDSEEEKERERSREREREREREIKRDSGIYL